MKETFIPALEIIKKFLMNPEEFKTEEINLIVRLAIPELRRMCDSFEECYHLFYDSAEYPNFLSLEDEYEYPCVIKKTQSLGVLCGYVEIPKNHPAFNKDYSELQIDCHGGLTFSGKLYDLKDNPIVLNSGWWIGFDCGHFSNDYIPFMQFLLNRYDKISIKNYKNADFVKNELKNICAQLKAMEKSE